MSGVDRRLNNDDLYIYICVCVQETSMWKSTYRIMKEAVDERPTMFKSYGCLPSS